MAAKGPRIKVDWRDLRKRLSAANAEDLKTELGPAFLRGEFVEPLWTPEYIDALQRSLELRDDAPLLELLSDRRPLHPQLLPLLAERLRGRPGRPASFTIGEEDWIAIRSEWAEEDGKAAKAFVSEEATKLRVSKGRIVKAAKAGETPRRQSPGK